MKTIKVLDVTLRDGGCVNNFNFGQVYMNHILSSLEQSNVDVIELGYIDETKGSEQGRTQFCNEQVISKFFLKKKKRGVMYVAMMDFGKFNIENLQPCTANAIDGIRVAFHKKDWKNVIPIGRKIIEKGYKFFIQPMITLRYSDRELLDLIDAVNSDLPDAAGFYIVDSFGEMRSNDIIRIMHLIDKNLFSNMTLGFHSHNNLQLSYANAMALLAFDTNRNIMLDSSVMGMGKGAGNLNTELLLEHLNLYYGKKYKISPLLELIDNVIKVIHSEFYWGYSVEYYLSSMNHCTPSYASHFYNKHMLPIDQVSELLSMISEDKKVSFDKEYAEQLYRTYNERQKTDDSVVVEKLTEILSGKAVLLIAPGKKIETESARIDTLLQNPEIISISLNNLKFKTDFVFVTRAEMLESTRESGEKIIAPSNIMQDTDCEYRIDYKRWIKVISEKTFDSSGVLCLNLLNFIHPKEILLAGFDGFSVDVNENYYSAELRRPVDKAMGEMKNEFMKAFIKEIGEKIPVKFVTESLYKKIGGGGYNCRVIFRAVPFSEGAAA